MAEENTESIRTALARVNDVTAERASPATGTDQADAEPDNLATRIYELEATAAKVNGELGLTVQPCRL